MADTHSQQRVRGLQENGLALGAESNVTSLRFLYLLSTGAENRAKNGGGGGASWTAQALFAWTRTHDEPRKSYTCGYIAAGLLHADMSIIRAPRLRSSGLLAPRHRCSMPASVYSRVGRKRKFPTLSIHFVQPLKRVHFLRFCLSLRATSRTISFSISNSLLVLIICYYRFVWGIFLLSSLKWKWPRPQFLPIESGLTHLSERGIHGYQLQSERRVAVMAAVLFEWEKAVRKVRYKTRTNLLPCRSVQRYFDEGVIAEDCFRQCSRRQGNKWKLRSLSIKMISTLSFVVLWPSVKINWRLAKGEPT